MIIKQIVSLCLIALFITPAFAVEKKMTIRGTIDGGTMLSSITTADDKQYTFPTDGKIADKIFKVCKMGDVCEITGMIDDESIQSVSSVKKAQQAYVTLNPSEKPDNKNVKERKKIEVKGILQFGHDAAGGNFWIDGGKGKQYTLSYVWDVNDADSKKMNELIDAGTKVTVRGTLKIWKDSSASFDRSEVIEITK